MRIATLSVMAACYASLLFEIAVLRVSSVASSVRIFRPRPALVAAFSPTYKRIFEWSPTAKTAAFAVPLLVVYAVFVFPWVVAAAGGNPLGDDLFTPGAVSDAAAILVMVAGRALALTAAISIRRDNRQSGSSFRLHTRGVFAWSRNPGLLGMYVFVIGVWLAIPSASLLFGIAVYMLYMHLKVLMEEDFLAGKFGARYWDYRHRTGRYLP